jgi:hypothetical protein
MKELEKNILSTLFENGCSEKQSIVILEEILKHIKEFKGENSPDSEELKIIERMDELEKQLPLCKTMEEYTKISGELGKLAGKQIIMNYGKVLVAGNKLFKKSKNRKTLQSILDSLNLLPIWNSFTKKQRKELTNAISQGIDNSE